MKACLVPLDPGNLSAFGLLAVEIAIEMKHKAADAAATAQLSGSAAVKKGQEDALAALTAPVPVSPYIRRSN